MKIVPLLALPLLAGAPFVAQRVEFAPEQGSSVTKNFSNSFELSLEDMSMSFGGEEIDASMLGEIEMEVALELNAVITDEYLSTRGGRPLKLRRTFDEILTRGSMDASGGMFGGDSQDDEKNSDLEGSTVLFSWNEESQEYDLSFEDGEGDEDLLDGLYEDMDLRQLLPDDEVSEGDSWKLELESLAFLLLPGGNLGFNLGEEGDEAEFDMVAELIGESSAQLIEELIQGEAVATYKGTTQEDERDVAVIELVLEISSSSDLSELVESIAAAVSEELGEPMEFGMERADLDLDFEGEGRLAWDIEASRLHSFELRGEAVIEAEVAIAVDAEGQEFSMGWGVELAGDFTLETSVEP